MSENVEKLKEQLNSLTSRERADLAHFLIGSLEEEEEEEGAEAAWEAEVNRRVDDIESGQVSGRPAGEVLPEFRDQQP